MFGVDENKLYTRREVANLGFRSYDRLAADAVNGIGIPMMKFGTSVRYSGKDIIQYIENSRVELEVLTK